MAPKLSLPTPFRSVPSFLSFLYSRDNGGLGTGGQQQLPSPPPPQRRSVGSGTEIISLLVLSTYIILIHGRKFFLQQRGRASERASERGRPPPLLRSVGRSERGGGGGEEEGGEAGNKSWQTFCFSLSRFLGKTWLLLLRRQGGREKEKGAALEKSLRQRLLSA